MKEHELTWTEWYTVFDYFHYDPMPPDALLEDMYCAGFDPEEAVKLLLEEHYLAQFIIYHWPKSTVTHYRCI